MKTQVNQILPFLLEKDCFFRSRYITEVTLSLQYFRCIHFYVVCWPVSSTFLHHYRIVSMQKWEAQVSLASTTEGQAGIPKIQQY